jgi:hypothetical protein
MGFSSLPKVFCGTSSWFLWLVPALLMGASEASSSLVINELLPDPAGADGGNEYVELINTGSQAIDLLGIRLQFANGIDGPVWVNRWTCETSLFLEPGGLFLLVDRNWMGPPPDPAVPQVEVWLGLQNGPDAIRLTGSEGQTLDLVGYGPLTDPALMELEPVGLQPGLALARRPDGFDSDNNRTDFVSHTPTPGAPNFQEHQWEATGMVAEPPGLDRPGLAVTFTVGLLNTGLADRPEAPVFLECGGIRYPSILTGCPSGTSREVVWRVPMDIPGRWPLTVVIPLAATGDTLRVPVGAYQVGPGILIINEVLAAPGAGQGEWIELLCPGPGTLDLAHFQIRDEEGSWQDLPEALLGAGQMAVLAQDPENLRAWLTANAGNSPAGAAFFETSEAPLMALPGSWPSLNNSAPPDRLFSDRVQLADSTGTVLDQVTLPDDIPTNSASGTSWERQAITPINPGAENWAPCTALAGSTPGQRNSIAAGALSSDGLRIDPAVLDPLAGVTVQHIGFHLADPLSGYWCVIFDTWGQRVRDLGGDQGGPGPRDLLWDGQDDDHRLVPSGAYVVVVQLRNEAQATVQKIQALTCVRRP